MPVGVAVDICNRGELVTEAFCHLLFLRDGVGFLSFECNWLISRLPFSLACKRVKERPVMGVVKAVIG